MTENNNTYVRTYVFRQDFIYQYCSASDNENSNRKYTKKKNLKTSGDLELFQESLQRCLRGFDGRHFSNFSKFSKFSNFSNFFDVRIQYSDYNFSRIIKKKIRISIIVQNDQFFKKNNQYYLKIKNIRQISNFMETHNVMIKLTFTSEFLFVSAIIIFCIIYQIFFGNFFFLCPIFHCPKRRRFFFFSIK